MALILAAGFSTRMGRCKATLPWQGQTLLSYQIQQWQQVGVDSLVVLGAHNHQMARSELRGHRAVINPSPELGKVGSIRLGLSHLPADLDWIAISAVDQPRPSQVYQELIQAFECHRCPITVPTYANHLGHPLLFRHDLRPELQALREETLGLRQSVTADPTRLHRVPYTDPGVLVDLNTPQHYQKAQPREHTRPDGGDLP